jgi:hypothetical protein
MEYFIDAEPERRPPPPPSESEVWASMAASRAAVITAAGHAANAMVANLEAQRAAAAEAYAATAARNAALVAATAKLPPPSQFRAPTLGSDGRRYKKGAVACVIEQCLETFVSEARMRRHVRDAHHGGRHRCPHYDQCGRDYSNSSALAQHMFVTHGATRIQCPAINCDRIFHSLDTLARHGARFHPELARDIFLATRRTRNGEAALPAPGAVTEAGAQITSEMFVNAGLLVRLNLDTLDRIAWADRDVDPAELERIDKKSPPYEFRCPWPNCSHVVNYRYHLRHHYITLHRTALGDDTVEFKDATPGILLDATTFAWTPPMSFTTVGPNGARVVPLPVSRGRQGADSVGVSRRPSDWLSPAGVPTATAPATEEMQRVNSALHCPAALSAGPIDIPQLRYVSACVAPRVLENPKPIPTNLRPQQARSAFTPFAQPASVSEPPEAGNAIEIGIEPSV